MSLIKLDKCPSCGSNGPMGLRSHPKFAVEWISPTAGLSRLYVHTPEEAVELCERLGDRVNMERWNGEEWIEFTEADVPHIPFADYLEG